MTVGAFFWCLLVPLLLFVESNAFSPSSSLDHHHDIIVIGGGIVGLATSVALLVRFPSLNIRIYERAANLRPMGAILGLFPNVQTALQHISPRVWQRIQENSLPFMGIQERSLEGSIIQERKIDVDALYLVWHVLQQEF